jgi:two-component system LytT family sensor kinase
MPTSRPGRLTLSPRHAAWIAGARLVVTVLLIWTGLATFLALQIYINAQARGRPAPLSLVLADSLGRYATYAVLTFPILWICGRFSFEPGNRGRSLAAHAAACVACHLVYATVRSITAEETGGGPDTAWTDAILPLVRRNLFEVSWMYASIVFVVLTLQAQRRARERELREADLRRRMAEYELQVLRLQLHPHFLFNTLNGIATLMARDLPTAREMLLRLGDLLRIALSRSTDEEIPLREELAFVRAYLDLEQMRFGDRLAVRLALEPEALEGRVPGMIIQPLVENAIRHGIEALEEGGRIELEARRVDGMLSIRILNDGPIGGPGAAPGGQGIGLRNARSRLARIHGDAFRLQLADGGSGRMDLRLDIPWRPFSRVAEGAA